MLIFIGSSTKKKRKAAYIAKKLESNGHAVLCWWEQFGAGDYTLDRLIELSRQCDGAVFVFGKDDKLWFSGTARGRPAGGGPRVDAPRDNVILEYGMFVARHGRHRVAIVVEGNVKLPKDLSGVTYLSTEKRYIEKLCERFSDASGLRGPAGGLRIIVANREGVIKAAGELPKEWATRVLYIGTRGANAWRNVELDSEYSVKRGGAAVTSRLIEMTKAHAKDHDTVVSFGPGVASVDMKLLPLLPCESAKKFIPIDMNLHLLVMAAAKVDGADPRTSVPFAICGDFEEGMNDIGSILEEHVTGRRLFMMLGGTFGNIESGETDFLGGLRNCMREGDLFLLDTFVKRPKYREKDDSFRDLTSQSASVCNFFMVGLQRKIGHVQGQIHKNLEVKGITSDVKGTSGFTFVTKNFPKAPLCYVRRYDFKALGAFLRDHIRYDLLESHVVKTKNQAVDRGLFLLKRR